MTRMLGPDDGCVQVDVAGHRINRHRDGTFHVPDGLAGHMKGDFTVAAIRMTGKGYRCPDCGFHAVFAHKCGKCGCADLVAE